MGFKDDVDEIMDYLPKSRQTLLFSATVPKELRSVMAATMKPDHVTVDCIQDDGEQTNSQVEQTHVILNEADRLVTGTIEIIWDILQTHKQNREPVKMIVFFPTAHMVSFYTKLFEEGLRIPVGELHSRKSQSYRTRVADEFRNASKGILFTTDVSARGVDYPGVTHVIQVRSFAALVARVNGFLFFIFSLSLSMWMY